MTTERNPQGHTPGPWFAYQNTIGLWGVETRRDRDDETWAGSGVGASIAMSLGDQTEARTRDNQEANARLIASAPELLEALEWIAANYENVDMNHVDFRVEAKHRADAAISKATLGGEGV